MKWYAGNMKKIFSVLLLMVLCTPFICTHIHTEECGENGETCTHIHEDVEPYNGKGNNPPE